MCGVEGERDETELEKRDVEWNENEQKWMCMCVCVCVCVRDRDRQTENWYFREQFSEVARMIKNKSRDTTFFWMDFHGAAMRHLFFIWHQKLKINPSGEK